MCRRDVDYVIVIKNKCEPFEQSNIKSKTNKVVFEFGNCIYLN